jgi:tetratricopeptide (TPR) repeat protein
LTNFQEQLKSEETGKLSFTDELTARFKHINDKVDKLVTLFECNVQSLQFSEQSAYFVSLNLISLSSNSYKDIGKRIMEWIGSLFKEHTSSAIIKYLYANAIQYIQKGKNVEYESQSLIFDAMKTDPELVMHLMEKNVIVFEKVFDHPALLESFYESSNILNIPKEFFRDKMISGMMSSNVFSSLYYTKFTDYEINVTEEKNLVKRINDALFLDKENVLAIIIQAYMKINDNSIVAEKMIKDALLKGSEQFKSNPHGQNFINIIGHFGLALIYRKRMIYDIAEVNFNRALDLRPPKFLEAILILNRGQNRLDDGNMSGALRGLLKAREQSHTAAFAHTNLGKLYFKQGLNSKAEAELLTAIENNPELAYAYFNLGVLYNEEGKKERAEKLFQTSLDLNRDFKEARVALKKLQETGIKGLRDWIDWWFGSDSSVYRKALGYAIITFAGLLLMIMAIYDTIWNKFNGINVSHYP